MTIIPFQGGPAMVTNLLGNQALRKVLAIAGLQEPAICCHWSSTS